MQQRKPVENPDNDTTDSTITITLYVTPTLFHGFSMWAFKGDPAGRICGSRMAPKFDVGCATHAPLAAHGSSTVLIVFLK